MQLDDTNDLTHEQRELLFAVENNDGKKFVLLGGTTSADLNFSISREGMSLLLIAAAKGHTEMINLIFQNNKVDVNKTDKYGVNAFWIASFYGHIETMRVLVQHKVDIYARNQNGSNALHMAVKRDNVEVIKELLRLNYDLQIPKHNGVTVLGIAALSNKLNLFSMLIDAGADPAFTNR